MPYDVIPIGQSQGIYAHFHIPIPNTDNINLLKENVLQDIIDEGNRVDAARDPNSSIPREVYARNYVSNQGLIFKINSLLGDNTLVRHSATNRLLFLLKAKLYVPRNVTNAPFVLLAHGAHNSYFRDVRTRGGRWRVRRNRGGEIPSYLGYEYIQSELANQGIASMSINVNLVNEFGGEGDYHLRELKKLIYLAMCEVMINGTEGNSHYLFHKNGSTLRSLHQSTNAQSLRSLKTALRRVDMGKIGIFGHSRGGSATGKFFNSVMAGSFEAMTNDTITAPTALITSLRQAIRLLLLFEPNDFSYEVNSDRIFCLLFAGTHDLDVKPSTLRHYEKLNTSKASIMFQGGTHIRFNTVWASDSKRNINRMIRCATRRDPEAVYVMSNRTHKDVAKHFCVDTCVGILLNQPDKLKILTGERRVPVRANVQRAWSYLKNNVTSVAGNKQVNFSASPNATLHPIAKLTEDPLIREGGNTYNPFVQPVAVDRITQEQAGGHVDMKFAITNAITNHYFSFRMAKFYNANYRMVRSRPSKRSILNFEIRVESARSQSSFKVIDGSAFRSLLQVAYPSESDTCETKTIITLQTVEVKLDDLLVNPANRSVLNDINHLVIRLKHPSQRRNRKDHFYITDPILTRRP